MNNDDSEGPGAARKTLRVLEALTEHSRVSDLANATGLPKSTVHRLLRVLVEMGFVGTDEAGEYRIGSRAVRLANRVIDRFDPTAQAEPALSRLLHETGCTVHFALNSGGELFYTRKKEPDKPYRMSSRVGMRLPWHSSAIGKAALAAMPPGELEGLLDTLALEARTPYSLTTREKLVARIEDARHTGYALDDGENEDGVRCVGAAVRDHTGAVIGGISISTLTLEHSMDDLIALAPTVMSAANAVSTTLGHLA
ncbi:DNA-binding IclR family transcriptional regulator [Saccharopolyspora lacisalsi]|uniref:DNA-binding IclR family transcriptional regulator n=1 Tax=Halosaccharopolyspora lacisalsi TaxID=1000566 RepID=A0A839DYC2_9PSEU|nr:IclR family transcriptional regulator [Halosaccharopolyspora lacisalsi]MBA8823758.1 DNA-binding IclR family transcriptional regulator [Halosaccharopolyspora lacisalsi]